MLSNIGSKCFKPILSAGEENCQPVLSCCVLLFLASGEPLRVFSLLPPSFLWKCNICTTSSGCESALRDTLLLCWFQMSFFFHSVLRLAAALVRLRERGDLLL